MPRITAVLLARVVLDRCSIGARGVRGRAAKSRPRQEDPVNPSAKPPLNDVAAGDEVPSHAQRRLEASSTARKMPIATTIGKYRAVAERQRTRASNSTCMNTARRCRWPAARGGRWPTTTPRGFRAARRWSGSSELRKRQLNRVGQLTECQHQHRLGAGDLDILARRPPRRRTRPSRHRRSGPGETASTKPEFAAVDDRASARWRGGRRMMPLAGRLVQASAERQK